MEYNDTTYSMYTLLIKWSCTRSKELNIVLVWCDCSPYHTLFFLGPRTFEKLVPTPLVEFRGWGPTLLSFFKAVRHWKLQWQVSRPIPVFSSSFHPCLGWRFYVTFRRWVEARRWLKADLHQHTTCASWSRFPDEIQWLRSPYYPKMMLIIQYLYSCFCFLGSQHIRGNADVFFKNWLA